MMTMQSLTARRQLARPSLAAKPTSTAKICRLSGMQRPQLSHGPATRSNRFVVRASANDELDFDKFLIILAKKWEGADNKGIVVGYSAAAVLLFFFTEWFIHLPVLDWILGFPIQLVGVFASPYLIVRWFVEKKDWFEDVSSATGTVVDSLPGLKNSISGADIEASDE